MNEAASLIEGAARTCFYWSAPRVMPTEAFTTYREPLAAEMEDAGTWRILTLAYYAINNLNWTVGQRRTRGGNPAEFDAVVLAMDETRETWRTIYRAIAELEDLIGASGGALSRLPRFQEGHEEKLWPFGDSYDFDDEAADAWQQEQTG